MIELAVLVAYIAFLAWRGFGKATAFASWHMFAGISICKFHLHDGDRPFNPWDHLPHTHTSMGRRELVEFLRYLRVVKGLSLHGTIECIDARPCVLEVRDGRPVY